MEKSKNKRKLDSLIEQYTRLLKRTAESPSENPNSIGKHIDFSNLKKLKEVNKKFEKGFNSGQLEDIKEIWSHNSDTKIINAVSNKCRLTTCLMGDNEEDRNKNLEKVAKNIYVAIRKTTPSEGDWEETIIKKDVNFEYGGLLKNNVQAFVKELFYVVNIEDDKFPLWNGCTDRAVKYLKEIENDYEERTIFNVIKDIKEKIKNNLPDGEQNNWKGYPYFYLTDKFFNLIDKLKANEIENKDEGIKNFYQNVWDYLQASPSAHAAKENVRNDLFEILDNTEGGNIVLYGPPGTSKTYGAEATIKAVIKKKSRRKISADELEKIYKERVKLIQFHPSYEYEDFIQGYKPILQNNNAGQIQFKLQDGHFKKFIDKVVSQNKKTNHSDSFFFIIDEINRADLSNVLGELMYCLEKRGQSMSLKYTPDEEFVIPHNVHIIGTMNTTDKSVDSFDIALRRRFIWLHRTYDSEVLTNILREKEIDEEKSQDLVDFAEELNEKIKNHPNLDENYIIGHAIFLNAIEKNREGKEMIQRHPYRKFKEFHLRPLLKEYLRFSLDNEKELEKEVRNLLKT